MRTERDIIDQAIAENRVPEYRLYAFAWIFVLTGEVLIGFSIYRRESIMTIAGVALNVLAWPAYYATRGIRDVNMMLRMLEVPLSKAMTGDEAARMLTETFGSFFSRSSSNRPAEARRIRP